jgi:hypothetical protein
VKEFLVSNGYMYNIYLKAFPNVLIYMPYKFVRNGLSRTQRKQFKVIKIYLLSKELTQIYEIHLYTFNHFK